MANRRVAGASGARPPAPYGRSVFVNCPFDADYLPLLHALVFAIHDCGYLARLAIEDTGGAELRVDKITRLIRESRFSIHDISRVDVDAASPAPRFNMPFEAGVAFGACRFDRVLAERSRDFMLLEAQAYRDQRTLSDLAGQTYGLTWERPATADSPRQDLLGTQVVRADADPRSYFHLESVPKTAAGASRDCGNARGYRRRIALLRLSQGLDERHGSMDRDG